MFYSFSVDFPDYEDRMYAITVRCFYHFHHKDSPINHWELM